MDKHFIVPINNIYNCITSQWSKNFLYNATDTSSFLLFLPVFPTRWNVVIQLQDENLTQLPGQRNLTRCGYCFLVSHHLYTCRGGRSSDSRV